VTQGEASITQHPTPKTCLAEFFQAPRRIDRAFQSPWLAVLMCAHPLLVVDLTGDFATRMARRWRFTRAAGACTGWARDLYEAFPNIREFAMRPP